MVSPPSSTTGISLISTAPASQAAPWGRAVPRWSLTTVPSHSPAVPTGMTPPAGLVGSGRWVRVGPPLSARAPSSGSVLGWSPVPANPHDASEMTLWPPEVKVPEPAQSVPVAGSAMIEPVTSMAAVLPLPRLLPVLSVTVDAVMVAVPSVRTPPPPVEALLPEMVLFVIATVPPTLTPPPKRALLPEMVESTMVTSPAAATATPPPLPRGWRCR